MKHGASQFVTVLAFIELIQNSSTFGLVIDVGESVNCFVDPPELGYSLSQLRWSITDLKRSHDGGSLNHAELQRSRQPEKVVPVLRDQFRVNPVTSNAIQTTIVSRRILPPVSCTADVRNARAEPVRKMTGLLKPVFCSVAPQHPPTGKGKVRFLRSGSLTLSTSGQRGARFALGPESHSGRRGQECRSSPSPISSPKIKILLLLRSVSVAAGSASKNEWANLHQLPSRGKCGIGRTFVRPFEQLLSCESNFHGCRQHRA